MTTLIKSIVVIVFCIATACAFAQELGNCHTRACRSFKELLAATDPLVMKSDRACFYEDKSPSDDESGGADDFFLLSTKQQANREVYDGSAWVHPNLISIEIVNGQPTEYTYYAPDKDWISGMCGYSGDRAKVHRLQPYEESEEEIRFAKLHFSPFAKDKTVQNAWEGCAVITIRKSTWRLTYHQEVVAGEVHYADYPGRCFVIPKQSARR